MSGKEEGFVPVFPKREKKDKKDKKVKQPQQEKPKETKAEKPAEEAKPLINENTIICNFCYQIGHKSDACPEKKAKSDVVYCSRCGKAGHVTKDCHVKFDVECFFCGESSHTYAKCPLREKFLHEVEGGKKESSLICRNCGAVGHLAHECKEPVQRRRLCLRCGEEGHTSSSCKKPADDPSAFRLCHHCGEIGHLTSECKVPGVQPLSICELCGQPGHSAENCPADMPSEPAKEKKPEPVKAPRKKLDSSDLQDTEQFPSL